MARKDALLRFTNGWSPSATRFVGSSQTISRPPKFPTTGDEADAANDGAQIELNTQLAALESRELVQVDGPSS